MTVYVEKPTINLREELASLRNQGGYQEQQFWFDSILKNSTFDVDAFWTKAGSWAISGGVATQPLGASANYLTQPDVLEIGKVYAYAITVVSGNASNFPQLYTEAGSVANFASGAGEYTGTFTAAGNDIRIRAISPSLAVSVDNISVFETDGTDVVHRMPKGWVPKDVFEDGLLQREGAANDYEVVYDGFDYYIKPAVAPSATTQTCVIGVKA